MNTHKILKRIPGINAEPGTEVDASEWRNAPMLEKQRYIKPLDVVAQPDGQQAEAGFDERVITAVKNDILSNGELAQLLQGRQAQTSARSPRQSSNKS